MDREIKDEPHGDKRAMTPDTHSHPTLDNVAKIQKGES